MNAVSRAFPAAPTIAAWWRRLASFQPRALWIADLLFHRVDALVSVERSCQADPLSLRILGALAGSPTMDLLERTTGLQRQFLHQALVRLRAEGLIAPQSWQLSAVGKQALEAGRYQRSSAERRSFYFRAVGDAPPPFFPARVRFGEPCPPAAGWHFDIAILEDCLHRPTEWKTWHGFPADVAAVDTPGNDWRHVAVDTPVRLTAVLVRVGDDEALRGFAYSSDDWTLDLAQPVFAPRLQCPRRVPGAGGGRRVGGGLARMVPHPWRHGSGSDDVPAGVGREPGTRVGAAPLKDRLNAAHDNWLLIGATTVRRTAPFDVEAL